VAEAGLNNVSFAESDICDVTTDQQFDTLVGRFILMFLPDPAAALRSLVQYVRPGGVVALQEPSYSPFVLLSAHLPLWSAGVSIVQETLLRSGANTEMGFALYRVFQEAGLPPPAMNLEMPLGNDAEFVAWVPETLRSLQPQIRRLNLSLQRLSDLDTLDGRLQAAVAESNSVVTWQALVGAWSHKPAG
jgi:Methyltransferase domain